MHKYVLLLSIVIGLAYRVGLSQPKSSQQFSSSYEVQKVPANPDVAQLGKFGDIPVNKYNGTANITVPIHEIDFEGLKIPIALKYNTSGVKVEQEASWVGLGWSLSDGMTITREVNGFEDIYDLTDNAKSQGWIYSRDYLFPNPEDNYTLPGELSEMDLIELQQKLSSSSSQVDLQPDFFNVNLPSGSCKFTLPKIANGAIILTAVISDSKNFKIFYDRVLRIFTVIDPQGFTYVFNVMEYSTGYGSYESNDNYTKAGVVAGVRFPNFQSKQMISSWRVSRITSPLRRQLDFTYTDGFYFSYPHFSESQDIISTNWTDFRDRMIMPIYLSQTLIPSPKMFGNMTAFNVKNLSLISGDFGTVSFVLSDRSDLVSKEDKIALSSFAPGTVWNTFLDYGDTLIAKKVDQIIVKNKALDIIKTANLSYSYFNSQRVGLEPVYDRADPFECDVSYIRLKLDRVDIGDQKYLFEYNQPDSLPRKDSRSVDFWGFYNGISNNTKIPSFNRFYANHPGFTRNDEWYEFFIKVNGGNRSADINYGKIGVLQKVTYPTGGYTIFDYEGHKVTMSNITFATTQLLSNGSGQLRFTNLTSSKDYKYSYQYMKLAKTPTYSLLDYNTYYNPCKVSPSSYQTGSNFQVSETSFCNNQVYNVKISPTISCSVGCGQVNPSGRAVWIRNINTAQEYNIYDYNNLPTGSLDVTMNLPPGNYQLMTSNWANNSPTVVWTTSATISVYATEFVPAPNIPIVNEEFEVGGPRIKSTSNYNSDGAFISKSNYLYDQYYNENGQQVSNGKLMDELIFHSKAQNLFDYSAIDFLQNGGGAGAVLSSDSKIITNPSAGGSHIGYSLVRDEKVDGLGNKLGQNVTVFNNNPNEYVLKPTEQLAKITSGVLGYDDFHSGINDLQPLGIQSYHVSYGSVYLLGSRPITYDYLNGSVLNESVYSQSSSLVKETINTYKTFQIVTYGGGIGAIAGQSPIVYYIPSSIIHFQPYIKILGGQYKLNIRQELTSTATVDYQNGNLFSYTTDNYFENSAHYLMTRSSTSNSDGNLYTTKYYYPGDLPAEPLMSNLIVQNRLTSPIIMERYKGNPSSPYTTLLEKSQTFYSNTNSTTGDVLPSSVFTYTHGDVVGQQRVFYEKYADKGTLLQYRKSSENLPISLLWGHSKLLPIAQVTNAGFDQIAYTSFDEPLISDGGWSVTGSITTSASKTGTKCLDTGATASKSGLPNGNYVVGFWGKLITGSIGTVTINGTPINITDMSWNYYEVTMGVTSISISNSNVYVDELRLYPVGSQMISYTHKPLVGMTSQTDPSGRVQSFEYDSFGRLLRIKDADGNIVKQYQYRYKN